MPVLAGRQQGVHGDAQAGDHLIDRHRRHAGVAHRLLRRELAAFRDRARYWLPGLTRFRATLRDQGGTILAYSNEVQVVWS